VAYQNNSGHDAPWAGPYGPERARDTEGIG